MQKFLFQKLFEDCSNSEDFQAYLDLIQGATNLDRCKLQITDPAYVYYESHHILPKSLYPEFEKSIENQVLLTAKEHYLAHKYLAKMFPDTVMAFAFWRLCTDGRGREVSAEDYELARVEVAKKSSIMNIGRSPSEETRKKLRLARLGYKHSEATKHKISNRLTGKQTPLETRQKISKANLGKPGPLWTDEARARISTLYKGSGNPMYGKINKDYMSEENYTLYRKHLSESLMGHEVSEETRRKIAASNSKRFKGSGNPRARRVLCIEDNIIFGTIAECGQYYGHSRQWVSDVVKAGYSKTLDKHFKFLTKESENN